MVKDLQMIAYMVISEIMYPQSIKIKVNQKKRRKLIISKSQKRIIPKLLGIPFGQNLILVNLQARKIDREIRAKKEGTEKMQLSFYLN